MNRSSWRRWNPRRVDSLSQPTKGWSYHVSDDALNPGDDEDNDRQPFGFARRNW